MRQPLLWIGITSTAIALVGCTASATTETDPHTSSTRIPRHVDQSTRPQVAFDPCLDIPDEALLKAGYDASSEKNADFPAGSYTFLGCSYDSVDDLYGMNALSGNISWAEEQEKSKDHATPIEINGRRALLKFNPEVRNSCDLSMETSYGMFGLTRSIFPDHAGPAPESEWCAGLEDIARIFERYIPKEG
ncbi:DUF3558 domain-containing protein [Rhodococcus koreensis]|uniref:DUF3558 domain-containing protein n=1 Tax=Rhodococcus koreensis TaxID=99653 RepID=A0A1H4YC28_9NOCA|nr:DUF3558 domain-containing protein [Rhodococcus koreensis]SED15552.1 Protein of unknown function [Rhodococcus koreensis]